MEALLRLLKTSIFLVLFVPGFVTQAQEETPKLISFKIKNAGVNVKGTFHEHSVTARFDENDLSNSSFEVSIEVESIDTGIKGRDKHLKKAKYFDLENHSQIVFKSKSVKKTAEGYSVTGELTIKATTLEVEMPFTMTRLEGENRDFKGNFTIDRRDYGVGKNHLIMGNEVKIEINYQHRPGVN